MKKIAGSSQCSKAWLGYLDNARKLLDNLEIKLEELPGESLAVITWFHYYDLMGQFTRRRWYSGRNPATQNPDIAGHIDPVARIEPFEVSCLFFSKGNIVIMWANTYLYHVLLRGLLRHCSHSGSSA